ncbi:Radical SAM domain protein [Caldicellulosiruptor owensensis OL]|uniref:Radical SAM domain protein n=1 Tax=Caldicellulosiruptor owensensis (strain ATCC 700167 / DSM 13100 / OL) TaxID=632518 RepID=E4Q2Q5_CALOW|nr:TatD family nuclease-associated radical SAM protein [Caldicellulosiruptor owensensis]ADQ03809.1 Radical SAM domain protein [Caldicellulosiruptor owensensis OL]
MGMITYTIDNRLYINVTNKCTNSCIFCIRNSEKGLGEGYDLWLEKDPTAEEILFEIKDPQKYDEIVFCGYGEPLIKLDVVIEVAKKLKEISSVPLRVNTNGHASYIHKKNVPQLLSGFIDRISISLNAPDKEKYNEICRPFDKDIYDHVIEFIKESRKYIKEVWVSCVDIISKEEIEECKKIAHKLGVNFKLRAYEE